MKKIFFILLLITFSCNKDSSSAQKTTLPARSGDDSNTIEDQAPAPDEDAGTIKTWTEEFVDLVNHHRRNLGLQALIHNDDMADIARLHSQNMAKGTVAFGHSGFSARCSEARSVLGGGNWCAENVATGQKTPEAAFTSWINSSGHRANIESSRATHMGFGYARSSGGKYYWTQIFLQR